VESLGFITGFPERITVLTLTQIIDNVNLNYNYRYQRFPDFI